MTDEQTARQIVEDHGEDGCSEFLHAAIVRALQAARKPPAGHIIDDQGVVRRVYCKTARYGFWIHDEDEAKPVDGMQQPDLGPTKAEKAKEEKA